MSTEKHRPGHFKTASRRRGRPRSLAAADEATVPGRLGPSGRPAMYPPMSDANTKRSRGRPRSLTAADEATVLDLRERKVPITRIAKVVGVHSKTVSRFLRDRGRPEKLDAAAVADEYAAGGETYARMADRYNTSVSTIARAVQARGRPAKRGRPGESDGRRGRGQGRGWQGEDYPRDRLGQLGREAWASWLAPMSDEERASVEAALTNLNTPLHDARATARTQLPAALLALPFIAEAA